MAHVAEHSTAPTYAHGLIAQIKRAVARQKAYRQTYKELANLTDRELADIGIARSMIHEIALVEADRV